MALQAAVYYQVAVNWGGGGGEKKIAACEFIEILHIIAWFFRVATPYSSTVSLGGMDVHMRKEGGGGLVFWFLLIFPTETVRISRK